jgi:hypothetical protein
VESACALNSGKVRERTKDPIEIKVKGIRDLFEEIFKSFIVAS